MNRELAQWGQKTALSLKTLTSMSFDHVLGREKWAIIRTLEKGKQNEKVRNDIVSKSGLSCIVFSFAWKLTVICIWRFLL